MGLGIKMTMEFEMGLILEYALAFLFVGWLVFFLVHIFGFGMCCIECVVWYKRENKTQIYIPEWTILLFEFLFVCLEFVVVVFEWFHFSTANEGKLQHSKKVYHMLGDGLCGVLCTCMQYQRAHHRPTSFVYIHHTFSSWVHTYYLNTHLALFPTHNSDAIPFGSFGVLVDTVMCEKRVGNFFSRQRKKHCSFLDDFITALPF